MVEDVEKDSVVMGDHSAVPNVEKEPVALEDSSAVLDVQKDHIALGNSSATLDVEKSDAVDLGRSGESTPTRVDMETQTESRPPLLLQLRRHFNSEVSTNHADVLMLACCLISGLTDSTLYNGKFANLGVQETEL